MMKKNLKTPRLELREITDADSERLIDLFTDETVKQTYMLPDFESREDAVRLFCRIRDLSRAVDRYVFAIVLDGNPIGLINDTEISERSIEVGYALLPCYHNQGLATEALQAMISYLFDVGFEEVTAGAFEENFASKRVMQKCGMKPISQTDQIDYRGKTHLCVYYAIRRATS